MKVSVIISVYNKLDFLKLVIAGFERQSFTDFELVVADDGSGEEFTSGLKEIIDSVDLAIQHIWHPDNGWQKNIILNKAIRSSKGEYLIFIDGDCIPHKDFVKDHYELSKKGELLAGRRVRLSEKISNQLTDKRVKDGWIERNIGSKILLDSWFGKTIQVEKGIRLRGIVSNKVSREINGREILGCNFSIHKEELVEINGFDERYSGPGIGEDIDIDLRYTNSGGKIMLLRNCAAQYHIYHLELPRSAKKENLELFNEHKTENAIKTKYGLNLNP